jgi:hypothetical protein
MFHHFGNFQQKKRHVPFWGSAILGNLHLLEIHHLKVVRFTEGMECVLGLGLLLIVSQWINPENSLQDGENQL